MKADYKKLAIFAGAFFTALILSRIVAVGLEAAGIRAWGGSRFAGQTVRRAA